MYCEQLQVIVTHKAHSSGTIISLGANEVIMTKQATLGPIDPSLNTELNPRVIDGSIFPVSVEAVKGYLEFPFCCIGYCEIYKQENSRTIYIYCPAVFRPYSISSS